MILGYVVADDKEDLGIAIHASRAGKLFIGHRYPILRVCKSLRRDGFRAFTRINNTLIEPMTLTKGTHTPANLPLVLFSLNSPYIYKGKTKSYVEKIGKFGFTIEDELFVPVYQTMTFGDVIWDHTGPDMIDTFYNAAGLTSDVQQVLKTLPLSIENLHLQITYNLTTKFAAESFGDVRVRSLWRDIPMAVNIHLDSSTRSHEAFDSAARATKHIYDLATQKSFRKMIARGYIPDGVPYDNAFAWDVAKDTWYSQVFLPGRDKMFESWIADVRAYHSMLLRVMFCVMQLHIDAGPATKGQQRSSFTLSSLAHLNLEPDDISGHMDGIGDIIDRLLLGRTG